MAKQQVPAETLQSSRLFEEDLFQNLWWEHLAPQFGVAGQRGEPFLVYRKPVAKGLWHLRELRLPAWTTAWNQTFSQDRLDALTSLMNSRPSTWDYCRLLPDMDGLPSQAGAPQTSLPFPGAGVPITPDYTIRIETSLEAYWQSLTSGTRSGLRNKFNRLQKRNPEWVAYEQSLTIEAFFEVFLPRHIQYWTQKTGHSYLSIPSERDFLLAWAHALHRENRLALRGLFIEGQLTSLTMAVACHDVWYDYLTLTTGAFPEQSPGLMRIVLIVQEALSRNVRYYYLGQGYEWKRQVANAYTPRYEWLIPHPGSWGGRAYVQHLRRQLQRQHAPNLVESSS